jgi:transcription antitermination factor NusG
MTVPPLKTIQEYRAKVEAEAKLKAAKPVDKSKVGEIHIHETEPRWFAVRTGFRKEKIALRMLTAHGVDAYLPIQKVTRRYDKKVRQVELPLINSFVFVHICKPEYKTVLSSEYVSGFLKLGLNILSIPDEQIELMRRLLGQGVELTAVPTDQYEKGDLVEVTSGFLLGTRGILVNIQGKDKLLVELVNSEHTLQISIDKALLSKIEE